MHSGLAIGANVTEHRICKAGTVSCDGPIPVLIGADDEPDLSGRNDFPTPPSWEVAGFYASLTIQPFDRIGAVFLPCDSRISEYH